MKKDIFRQKELSEWQKKNFGCDLESKLNTKIFWNLVGMSEELGELAHAILKYDQGIRNTTEEEMKLQVADAFGDIIIYGVQLLSELHIDAEKSLSDAIDTVLKRNWKENKFDGS